MYVNIDEESQAQTTNKNTGSIRGMYLEDEPQRKKQKWANERSPSKYATIQNPIKGTNEP